MRALSFSIGELDVIGDSDGAVMELRNV
jgi:hypothetical protein